LLQDIATAVGLMLVFEGIMPFCLPNRWRKMASQMAVVDNRTMRAIGLFSMLIGLGLLLFLR
jgi:uncharacterized protein YjeT (DUF2065 family)